MKIITNTSAALCLQDLFEIEEVLAEELLNDHLSIDEGDIIIIDIDYIGGVLTARSLREKSDSVSIIGITKNILPEHDWSEQRSLFLEYGGDYLLRLHESPRELIASVNSVARRTTKTEVKLPFLGGRLVIDLKLRRVVFDDEMMHFSRYEEDILFAIAKSRANYISNHRIQDIVWGTNSIDQYNKVAVYLSRIRSRLNALHPDMGLVVDSKRGKGYRLTEIN